MYRIDFSDSNRIYRINEGTCEVLDPLAIEWHACAPASEWTDLTDAEAKMYLLALETAKEAHRGQKDKGGNDYFTHPVSVSALTKGSLTAVISALLHDTVEDTDITLEKLRELGMSEEVIACVDCLTHREGEPRKDYLERIAANYDAVCVKLADLTHNSDLSRIADPSEKDYQRIDKYRKEYEALSKRKAELEGKMNHE
ncbi:MAG: HD domain-containing protein [Solobacterium sp.]|nr:HD domain-containing protein [Solobacterium sp.]